ncbi:hypothetical protein HK101_000821, partial [Irineochytrium annulatum]
MLLPPSSPLNAAVAVVAALLLLLLTATSVSAVPENHLAAHWRPAKNAVVHQAVEPLSSSSTMTAAVTSSPSIVATGVEPVSVAASTVAGVTTTTTAAGNGSAFDILSLGLCAFGCLEKLP